MSPHDNAASHPLSRLLPNRPQGPMQSPARALGWFSIALGLAELAMPQRLSRAAGLAGRHQRLVRLGGLREIGVGIGLLSARDPQPWLWARVAGDALDIATVAGGALGGRTRPLRALASLGALAGVMMVDARCAAAAAPKPRRRPMHDYRDRSGFPKPAEQMRGAARVQGGVGAGAPPPADAADASVAPRG